MRVSLASPTVALALVAMAVPAFAADAVPGHAVLARPWGEALVIWDATPAVAEIVKSKLNDARANDLLEHDAARVLAGMASNFDTSAKTVTVRVIYRKVGAVDPQYGTPEFIGVERYANLIIAAADTRTDRDSWKELDANAPLPAWFAFKVTGSLPPR